MKPTIGRIVHFYSSDAVDQRGSGGAGPYAALITHVWSDQCVNLTIFNDTGELRKTSVMMKDWPEESAPTMNHWWEWPPKV